MQLWDSNSTRLASQISRSHPAGQTIPDTEKEASKLTRAILLANETFDRLAQRIVHGLQNPARKNAKILPIESNSIARHIISPHRTVMSRSETESQKAQAFARATGRMHQHSLPGVGDKVAGGADAEAVLKVHTINEILGRKSSDFVEDP